MKNACLPWLSVFIAFSVLFSGCTGCSNASPDGGIDSGVESDVGDAALDGNVPDDGSVPGDGGYFTCDEDAGNRPAPWCGASGDPCTSDGGCCMGSHCNTASGKCEDCLGTGALCASDSWCCPWYFCSSKTGACVACDTEGGNCGSNRDCCSGTYCDGSSKKCVSCKQQDVSCSADAECCSGTFCINSKCLPCQAAQAGCARARDCCSGLVCNGSKCTATCTALGGECGMDGECCRSADPLKGVWCNSYSVCAECSKLNGACTRDYDCCPVEVYGETPLLCSSKGVCSYKCGTDRDCPPGESCMANNTCAARPCSSDTECGGKKCCSGSCMDDCGYGTPDGCRITSTGGAVFSGQKIKLSAVAYKGDVKTGGMIVPWAAISWASSDTAAAAVDSAGTMTGGGKEGVAEISASVGGKACDNKISYFSYAGNTNGSLVLVFNEMTGLPVSGAKVIVNGATAVTDSNGSAKTDTTGDVHVFHPDYAYVSVIGVQRNNYVIHLPPRPDVNTAGGYKGAFKFDGFDGNSNGIQGGCAATSLSSGLFDVSKTDVTGRPILTHITFQQPVPYNDWEWVGSGMMEKDNYFGKPDLLPSYRVAGESGLRMATALAGGVSPLFIKNMIPVMTSWMGESRFPLNKYYGALQPAWSSFKHVVSSAFDVTPIPQITTTCKNGKPYGDPSCDKAIYGSPKMPDFDNFPKIDLEKAVPAGLKIKTKEPVLPMYKNVCLDAVELIAASDLPGVGMSPTGFSIGMTNVYGSTNNCRVQYVQGFNPFNLAENEMMLFAAPNHHGMETSRYAVIEAAVKFDTLAVPVLPDKVELMYSIYVPSSTVMTVKLTRMESIPRELDLTKPFLGFADGSKPNTANRTVTVPATPVEGASLYMFKVKGQTGDWLVYAPTDKSPKLPNVPKGMNDYLSEASQMVAYAVQLDGATLASLVSSCGGVHLDGIGNVTAAFSRVPVSMY